MGSTLLDSCPALGEAMTEDASDKRNRERKCSLAMAGGLVGLRSVEGRIVSCKILANTRLDNSEVNNKIRKTINSL